MSLQLCNINVVQLEICSCRFCLLSCLQPATCSEDLIYFLLSRCIEDLLAYLYNLSKKKVWDFFSIKDWQVGQHYKVKLHVKFKMSIRTGSIKSIENNTDKISCKVHSKNSVLESKIQFLVSKYFAECTQYSSQYRYYLSYPFVWSLLTFIKNVCNKTREHPTYMWNVHRST